MASGSWVLRPGAPAKTIFVVTGSRDTIVPIADRVASPSYFLVVGLPDRLDTLVRSIRFHLLVVLANVDRDAIALLESRLPLHGTPVLVTDVTEIDLCEVLRRHV